MGVYGIAVLSFFSSGISVILILMCGIAVSSSRAVCGLSSFWLTVFGKRRSFTVLRYCSFGLSCLMQVNIWKSLDLTVNEYTISDKSYSKIGRTSNDLAFRSLYRSIRDLLTWRRLRLISCVYMLEIKTREMDTALSKRHRS